MRLKAVWDKDNKKRCLLILGSLIPPVFLYVSEHNVKLSVWIYGILWKQRGQGGHGAEEESILRQTLFSIPSETIQAMQCHQAWDDELWKCLTTAECVLCHGEPRRQGQKEPRCWWGVKMNSCFCSKGQKGEPQMGNGSFFSSGLCSVAIYPTQWSRTSTLAAEDKERKGSGWVLSALFKQRIPCGYAMCEPSPRDVRAVLHIQRWSLQRSDPLTHPQKQLN